MRTILWMLGLVILSCSKKVEIPNDVMDKEKMAAILTEIHLAEARVAKFNLRSMDSSVVVFNKLQQEIWKKYETDSSYYKKSYAFYATHPEILNEVYQIVKENLEMTDSSAIFTVQPN